MGQRKGGLTGKRHAGALLVARGLSADQVAEGLHVGRSSVYRWLDDAAFVRAVDAIRQRLVGDATGRLSGRFAGIVAKATDELEKMLDHENPTVRLRAILIAFEQWRPIVQLDDHGRRLAAVEEAVAKVKK